MINKKIQNWLLVILWASFIFFLSHQPDLKSNFPDIWDFVFRKIAHISEYFILTFLLIRAFKEYDLTSRQILIFSIGLALIYAVSDEYHQTFVFKRTGAFQDVLIDSIGIFLLAWLNRRKMIK